MQKALQHLIEHLKGLRAEGRSHVQFEPAKLEALAQTLRTRAKKAAGGANALGASEADTSVPQTSATREHPPKIKMPNTIAQANTSSLGAQGSQKTKMQNTPEPATAAAVPIPQPTAFELPEGSKLERWEWLRQRVLACPTCTEHTPAGKKIVFGLGNLEADIFFCGEAPGADEAIKGEPFVGRAGGLLDKIIMTMGLTREQVYIGNIMNWRPEHDRPSGNRPPSEAEINFCLPYLAAQLEIVQPKVIVALGRTAANGLLGYDESRSLGSIRSRWLSFNSFPLMVTYHPSYLLRNSTLNAKRKLWEDILLVMERLKMPISEPQRKFFQPRSKP